MTADRMTTLHEVIEHSHRAGERLLMECQCVRADASPTNTALLVFLRFGCHVRSSRKHLRATQFYCRPGLASS